MQITRRALAKVALGSACVCCGQKSIAWPGGSTVRGSLPVGGCSLFPDDVTARRSGNALYSSQDKKFSTGDKGLDRHLGKALVRISKYFGVTPAFGFYNEMNAQAAPEVDSQIRNTWGVVLFGVPLFRQEMNVHDKSGMTVLAIIAHEFAHIVQFRRRLPEHLLANQPTVKRLELHADILAGFYLGNLKMKNPRLSFYSAGEVFHRIGDSNFTSRNHHGTPQERAEASNLGFQHGGNGQTTLDQMIDIGVRYVTRA